MLLCLFPKGQKAQQLRVQIRICTEDVKHNTSGRSVVSRSDNHTIVEDDDEFKFIVILEIGQRINCPSQLVLTRNLTNDKLVMILWSPKLIGAENLNPMTEARRMEIARRIYVADKHCDMTETRRMEIARRMYVANKHCGESRLSTFMHQKDIPQAGSGSLTIQHIIPNPPSKTIQILCNITPSFKFEQVHDRRMHKVPFVIILNRRRVEMGTETPAVT
ncbi:hypothetical protein VKT23_008712 [Stygiomarasmius scandens]|uniref:Uncharacterized protein n=1 Tax=Marasmiellus scandens TaxID=2682957 RepID=A0ABR1JK06_9AGAR